MTLLSTTDAVDSLISARLLAAGSRQRALAVLARVEDLSPPPPTAAASAPATTRTRPRSLTTLVEVVGYLGAALVLAAALLLVGQYWDRVDLAAQVGGLLVATVVLAGAGVLVGRAHRAASRAGGRVEATARRMSSTLLTLSALTASGVTGLVVDHAHGTASYEEWSWTWVAASTAALAVTALGRRLVDSAFAVLVLFASSVSLVYAVLTPWAGESAPAAATAGLALAAVWLLLAERTTGDLTTLRRTLGLGLALYAAQQPLLDDHAWLAYLLTSLVVALSVAGYVRTHAWPYLATAVVGVTVVVPEALVDWTHGDLGVAGSVLLTGLTLLSASLVAVQVRRRTA